ncbi:hypothetical protein LP52_10875 [Streptomonospora alba]|uniref:Acetone carboxylase n=1 Tax=Streptomonospora alba TaxID=183763 RepID=A0A0C2G6J6_9ACTN|nr:hypothetical protein [Streptomonospora alba]KIH98918.1 hypothetical protein LP52_10875 [Streptomonospora alba]
MTESGAAPEDEAPHCSRKDCRADAAWVLVWNNPKVHTPERRKTWVACDEHRAYLAEFLDKRGFLLETVPVADFEG